MWFLEAIRNSVFVIVVFCCSGVCLIVSTPKMKTNLNKYCATTEYYGDCGHTYCMCEGLLTIDIIVCAPYLFNTYSVCQV